jgi:hypothetical protein
MFVKIGSYSHPANEVDEFVVNQQVVRNQRNRRQHVTKRLTLGGVLNASTQADIRTAIRELETAYARDDKSVGLYHDDGSASPHVLDSSKSIGGVRIVSVEYPSTDGAEYATGRTFRIVAEADYLDEQFDQLIAWQESLSFIGNCGPRDVHKLTLNGPPQKQTVHQRTVQTVTQRGSAVGFQGWPFVPSPLFPAALKNDQVQVEYVSPTANGNGFTNYPANWSYVFESAVPLAGRPNTR